MRLIFENWRKFNEEEKRRHDLEVFFENRVLEKNRELTRPDLLNELEASVGPSGIRVSTQWEKWAAIMGISSGAMVTAVSIASMYAGWEGVLIVLIPALLPIVLNPVVMTIGATLAMRSKLIRKIVGWIFKKIIGKDTVERISDSVSMIIDKMVESSDGKLSRENAMEIYGKLASYIAKDSEFRSKIKEFYGALKEGSQEKVAMISSELDDLVENIIKRDILEVSEEEELEDVSSSAGEAEPTLPHVGEFIDQPDG